MAKTIIATAFAVAVLTTTAAAQGAGGMGGGGGGGGRHHQQQDKKDKTAHAPKADEKAYNEALKSIPNKPPADAWSGMR